MKVKDVEKVRDMIRKWTRETNPTFKYCPPEARYLTGNQYTDAMFHYFSLESGLDPIFSLDLKTVVGYDIVDEQKFTWFTLRWS